MGIAGWFRAGRGMVQPGWWRRCANQLRANQLRANQLHRSAMRNDTARNPMGQGAIRSMNPSSRWSSKSLSKGIISDHLVRSFLVMMGWLVLVLAVGMMAPVLASQLPHPATPTNLLTSTPSMRSVAANPSPTGSIEELQQQQRKIETERSNIDQARDRIQRQERSVQQQLGTVQSSIRATADEIARQEQRLQQASQQLKRLEQELAKTSVTYQAQQRAMVARLRFLQRQRQSDGLAVLLQSQNLNDFLDRRYQLRRVYQSDRQLLARLKQQTDAITRQRSQVESQKNEIALIRQQLQAQKLDFQQDAKEQQALINRLRLDRKALEAAEEQLAKDSDNIAALIQQRLGTFNPGLNWQRGKGVLSYPCDAPLTSGFGYRMHPILGYTKFHSGLDFGADYGTPIRAAGPGKVLFAGWYGGYGQTVILDHGNQITTLYGHAEEVYVTEGQMVKRGTPIAAVGSTGLSTGPHLHFEVRVSGEPIDPMEYL